MDLTIRPFQQGDIPQVAQLISHLWTGDPSFNEAMLQWKYFDLQPFHTTTAFVGWNGERIVGFRGYFPSIWSNGSRQIRVLTPSDAVVDPDYRRRGFFSSLTTHSISALESCHDLFLNTSSNTQSIPGYLKLSWEKLFSRDVIYRLFKLRSPRDFFIQETSTIRVSESIQVSEIESLLEQNETAVFQQCYSPDYFRWRFSRPHKPYVFVSLRDNRRLSAMLILEKSNDGRLLDYFDRDSDFAGLKRLMNHLKQNSSLFRLQMFKNVTVQDRFAESFGFIQLPGHSLYKKIRKKQTFFLFRKPGLVESRHTIADPSTFLLKPINADGA